jgi:hypothetical protein
MEFLRNLTLKRAAKRYARELPGELRRSYGASERYTPAQVRTAVATAKLDERFVVLAYAAYLTEGDFAVLAARLPNAMSYAAARAVLACYRPHGLTSASGDPEVTYSGDGAHTSGDASGH